MDHHPVFWLLLAAVAAPLLAEVRVGFKVPVVVLEVVLGIVIGPHVLHLVEFDTFLAQMFTFAMAATLFMAGIELDFEEIRGRPLSLAARGWLVSALLAIAVVGTLHVIPDVHAPAMVALTLCTTGFGILMPVFRDSGQLETRFGRLILAAGTFGEVAPVVAMSLLLSQRYSTWQEFGFLLAFLGIVGLAIAVGMGARPPRLLAFLNRQMHSGTQLPIRMSLLILAALFVLAQEFGFESIFGAFAAGMIVGQASKGEGGKPFRDKLEALTFGWFYPFFFVGTGIKFDMPSLVRDATTMILVLVFVLLFLAVRGLPVLLYRRDIERPLLLPFALSSAVPSLSIIVVISDIGARTGSINADIGTAMVGGALLSVMLFPTIAGTLLTRRIPASGLKPRNVP